MRCKTDDAFSGRSQSDTMAAVINDGYVGTRYGGGEKNDQGCRYSDMP
jgi:hypothetical protein